jgi:hypothetical protein
LTYQCKIAALISDACGFSNERMSPSAIYHKLESLLAYAVSVRCDDVVVVEVRMPETEKNSSFFVIVMAFSV